MFNFVKPVSGSDLSKTSASSSHNVTNQNLFRDVQSSASVIKFSPKPIESNLFRNTLPPSGLLLMQPSSETIELKISSSNKSYGMVKSLFDQLNMLLSINSQVPSNSKTDFSKFENSTLDMLSKAIEEVINVKKVELNDKLQGEIDGKDTLLGKLKETKEHMIQEYRELTDSELNELLKGVNETMSMIALSKDKLNMLRDSIK
jgi:hypothetical protein